MQPLLPMKKNLLLSTALILFFSFTANHAIAEENASDNKVAAQFDGLTSILEKKRAEKTNPDKDAKFYILLFSSSWCGPCRKEMPRIVNEYNDFIKPHPDIELILISCDKKDSEALRWAKEENMSFPILLPDTKNKRPDILKKNTCSTIPRMLVVDAQGEKIMLDHPAKVLPLYKKELDLKKLRAALKEKKNKNSNNN